MALENEDSEALRKTRAEEGRSVDPAEIEGLSPEEILNYVLRQHRLRAPRQ